MEYYFNVGGKTLFNKMLHFMFFNLGYFRIRFCFKSHSTTTSKTLSQEKKACSNSPPGNYSTPTTSLLFYSENTVVVSCFVCYKGLL